jgi:hypothetical protein
MQKLFPVFVTAAAVISIFSSIALFLAIES